MGGGAPGQVVGWDRAEQEACKGFFFLNTLKHTLDTGNLNCDHLIEMSQKFAQEKGTDKNY